MKVKKLLSTFAALAIAASSFAGLGINANAATADEGYSIKYEQNFDALDAVPSEFKHVLSWTGAYHENSLRTGGAIDATGKYYANAWNNAGGNMQGAFTLMPLTETADGVVKVSFNLYLGQCNNGGIYNFASLIDNGGYTGGTSGNNGYVNTSDILQLQYDNSKNLKLIYTDKDGTVQTEMIHSANAATKSWETVTAEINCITGTLVSLSCKNSGMADAVVKENIALQNDFTGISALAIGRVRTGGNVKVVNEVGIDDIVVQKKDTYETSVTVKDDNGNALSGVEVKTGSYTATTDATGVAKFSLPEGSYTFSTELAEIEGSLYEAGTATLAVSENTTTVDLTMKKKAANPSVITVKFVDAANNSTELKSSETVSEDIYQGVQYDATDAQKANIDYTDKNGIQYTATLNEESATSVTPNAETAELVLKFDLTEKTYSATVNTAIGATVKVTGTSKSGISVDKTYYSKSGATNCTELPVSGDTPYTVTVTKSGYNQGTGTLEVTADGQGTSSVSAKPTEENVLFYEDYTSDGCTDGSENLLGSQRYKREVMHLWNSQTINIDKAQATALKVDIASLSAYPVSAGDRSRTKSIAFKNGTDNVFTITFAMTGGASPVTTLTTGAASDNSVTLTGLGALSLYIADGKISGTVGKQEISLNTVATAAIDSIVINAGAESYLTATVGNITISAAPKLTVDLTKAEIVPADDVAITPVEGGDTVTYSDLKGEKNATMVYIKVDNAVKDVAPVVTLDIDGTEETAQATHFKSANSDGYFIYQIISDKAVTVKSVSYTGAEAWTSPADPAA